jgi:hypothetical protein
LERIARSPHGGDAPPFMRFLRGAFAGGGTRLRGGAVTWIGKTRSMFRVLFLAPNINSTFGLFDIPGSGVEFRFDLLEQYEIKPG